MGIQATVKILDLLGAGCTLEPIKESGYDPTDVYYSLVVTFPTRSVFVFNGGGPGDTSVWTDVNHWGSNRQTILPLLEQHGIPFIEA